LRLFHWYAAPFFEALRFAFAKIEVMWLQGLPSIRLISIGWSPALRKITTLVPIFLSPGCASNAIIALSRFTISSFALFPSCLFAVYITL